MPANELSLRVYFMERFDNKVVYQKCVLYLYWKQLLAKDKKNTVSYASTTNQIKIYWRLFKKMSEVLLIPVTTEILLDLIPCQAKGKFLYPLKR